MIRMRAWLGLVLVAARLLPLQAGAADPPPERVLRLERTEPDYRFGFHPTYRAPGQRRLALALRGGSAKGLAHLGVLEGFDQENLPVDAIVGTSAGSLMGALYATGFSADGIARIFKSQDFGKALDDRQRTPGTSLSEDEIAHAAPLQFEFRGGGLDLTPGGNHSQRVRANLVPMLARSAWLAGGDFDRLRMPLRVVASDLTAGRGKVFRSGSLVDAVLASSGIPGVFASTTIDGHQYVDGGPIENLPVQTARQEFPDMVQVGVAIGRPWDPAPKTNLLTIMDASLDLAMAQTEARSQAAADLVLRPRMDGADEFDFFHQVDALVTEGRKAFDDQREALEDLLYGPEVRTAAGAGLDLDAPEVPGAEAWFRQLAPAAPPTRGDLYRLLRRAHLDLAVDTAEAVLPATPSGRVVLVLRPSPVVRSLVLDLPDDWDARGRQALLEHLWNLGLVPGRPFNEGAWNQALEGLLVGAILHQAPILDLQGSGLQPDGTLRLQVREPRIRRVVSRDPAYQRPLERLLAPLEKGPVRTLPMQEALARSASRLGLTELRPEFRQEGGELELYLDPQPAPQVVLVPHLAYESAWGGHVALDAGVPNFLGSGSMLQLYGAKNDLMTRFQSQCLMETGPVSGFEAGPGGSEQRQWFNDQAEVPVSKLVQNNAWMRLQARTGMEHRGLLQADLGQGSGSVVHPDGSRTPLDRAWYVRTGFEWDSFDAPALPTTGTLVRAAWFRAYRADTGPDYTTGYLRLRGLTALNHEAERPEGLDLDLEAAAQKNAPAERWFIAGGPDSFIGTPSASILVPNFAILRAGAPFSLTTLLGVGVQAVPRIDLGRFADDSSRLLHGSRALGYGLVLRGAVRSLYVELAAGRMTASAFGGHSARSDRTLSFLIGTRPFDLWKGR